MGAEVLLAIAVVSEVGKASAQSNAASAQMQAFNLERQQEQLQTQQKLLSTYDQTDKILQAQQANAAARGLNLASDSLGALQRNTINISAKNIKNINEENDIFKTNIKIEKQNVRSTLTAQLFGDLADTASSGFGAYNKLPRF